MQLTTVTYKGMERVLDPSRSASTWMQRIVDMGNGPKPGSARATVTTGVKHFLEFIRKRNSGEFSSDGRYSDAISLLLPTAESFPSSVDVEEQTEPPYGHARAPQENDILLEFCRYLFEGMPSVLLASTIKEYLSQALMYINVQRDAVGLGPMHQPLVLSRFMTRLMQVPRASSFKDAAPVALIAAVVYDESASLATRVVAMCQWFLTLRVGNLTTSQTTVFDPQFSVLRRDLSFSPDGSHARFILKKLKNCKWNKGSCRYLLRATDANGFCALDLLRRFYDSTAHFADDQPLMRHADGRCVTADHVNVLLKKHAARLGLDPRVIASHSLRSGSATQLNADGWDLEYIQLWGSWSTQEGCLRYIRLTTDLAVRITKSLQFDRGKGTREVLSSRPRL